MVRLADLIKKKWEETQKKQAQEAASSLNQEKDKVKQVEIAKAMRQFTKEDSKIPCLIYEAAYAVAKDIFDKANHDETIDFPAVNAIVSKIVNQLVVDDRELMNLALTRFSPDNYLWCHTVNVCIISIEIGMTLKYNKSGLNEVGLGALLHDIGIAKILDIAFSDMQKLSAKDIARVKNHPVLGSEIMRKSLELDANVVKIILQHHERVNGVGYPQEIKGESLSEHVQIVGLADLFDTKIHPRPYKAKVTSYEFMKELLTTVGEDLFSPRVIKALVTRVGIYPIGNWVRLSTNQIGRVTDVNERFPLRPVVSLLFDNEGHRLEQPKIIDLSEQKSGVHIKEIVDDIKFNLKLGEF